MNVKVPLLVIGAGPYGLGLGAFAQHHGLDYQVVGKVMDCWQHNIPEGQSFREVTNWHFDPVGGHTIDDYLSTLTPGEINGKSLSSQFLLDYAEWFRKEKAIKIVEKNVTRLDFKNGFFTAVLKDGAKIKSERVVVAWDRGQFPYLPRRLTRLFKRNRYEHSGKISNLASLHGKRCLIIGNRRSAFEWAALLLDNGVRAVHISTSQSGPQVEKSDWSWLNQWIDNADPSPAAFRTMKEGVKEEINHRIWLEGMGKVEPSVKQRMKANVTWIWKNSRVMRSWEHPDGPLKILLDCGERLTVDFVLLATGYKADTSSIPFIANGNIANELQIKNGYPALDDTFQSNVPGLFFTSYPAARDFGEFFAYTMAVQVSSKIIGGILLDQLSNN